MPVSYSVVAVRRHVVYSYAVFLNALSTLKEKLSSCIRPMFSAKAVFILFRFLSFAADMFLYLEILLCLSRFVWHPYFFNYDVDVVEDFDVLLRILDIF